MAAIGIDFGSCYCRLAYQPAGSSPLKQLGEPVSSREVLGKGYTFPYLYLKIQPLRPTQFIQLFRSLQKEAEKRLDQPVTACVVSIPVNWGSQERIQLKDAVNSAGFTTVSLISEPAALASGQIDRFPAMRPVLMYMLGESALTIAIYKLEANNVVEVASKRDEQISSIALTNRLAECLIEQFAHKRLQENTQNSWRVEAERIKIGLSTAPEETLRMPRQYLATHLRTSDSNLVVKRKVFEEVAQPLFQQSLDQCTALLESAKLTVEDLGDVWLAGSSRSIPLLGRMLADWFGRGPVLIDDYAIAYGCARQCAWLPAATKQEEAKQVLHSAQTQDAPVQSTLPVQQNQSLAQGPNGGKTAGDPPPIVAVWQESERRMAAGDFDGALNELIQVDVLLKKQRALILYQKGQTLFNKALQPSAPKGLLEQAMDLFKRAVDMDGDHPEYKQARERAEEYIKHQRARERYKQGNEFADHKKWDAALGCYREAYMNDPAQDDYRFGLAYALVKQAEERVISIVQEFNKKGKRDSIRKWWDEVDRWTKEAVKIAPDNPNVIEHVTALRKTLQQLIRH